jgi:hypothetical protein
MASSSYNLAQTQDGVPLLFGSPLLLIQYIRSYSPYWRSFLYPLPEDVPSSGDRHKMDRQTDNGIPTFILHKTVQNSGQCLIINSN